MVSRKKGAGLPVSTPHGEIRPASGPASSRSKSAIPLEASFTEIVQLIHNGKQKAFHAVNTTLIDLYWQVGGYILRKVETEKWGKSVVQRLADHIQRTEPGLRGFSSQNLWRMRQFHETYLGVPKLSALLRELHPMAEVIFKRD